MAVSFNYVLDVGINLNYSPGYKMIIENGDAGAAEMWRGEEVKWLCNILVIFPLPV